VEIPDEPGPVPYPATTCDVDPSLLTAMIRLGRSLQACTVAPQDGPVRSQDGAWEIGDREIGDREIGDRDVGVLAARGESVVVRVGPVVVKAHHLGSAPAQLTARLALAAGPLLAGTLLPPLLPEPQWHAGRWLTVWPFGRTVEPDPDRAPWTAAARLLARLHAVPVSRLQAGAADLLPRAGGPARACRTVAALAHLGHDADADAVRAAWQTLPAWVRQAAQPPGPVCLTHGDWHFGQLISDPAGRWLLGDVDDLGLGDPLWDLGRPAAFCAVGVVTGEEFAGFLDEYRAAGGPLDAGPDRWTALDVPARAYAVQTAARSLLAARRSGTPPDDVTRELLSACRRMVVVES
jgi:hypothetical protein